MRTLSDRPKPVFPIERDRGTEDRVGEEMDSRSTSLSRFCERRKRQLIAQSLAAFSGCNRHPCELELSRRLPEQSTHADHTTLVLHGKDVATIPDDRVRIRRKLSICLFEHEVLVYPLLVQANELCTVRLDVDFYRHGCS